jgi:tyrosine-protein kinase Etk/Wzc
MNKSEEIQVSRQNNGEGTIDLKKTLNRLIDNWYLFFAFALAGLVISYMYAHYTPPLYKINARVLVNDQQKGAGIAKQAEALMDLGGIMGSQSSVDNEAELLQTPDLVEEVVREMKLNINYSSKPDYVWRQMYSAPFSLILVNEVDTISPTRLEVTQLAGNKIRVRTKNFDRELNWNESFNVPGVGSLKLVPEPGVKMLKHEYDVSITSVDQEVASLMHNMTVKISNKQATIIDIVLNYPVPKKGEEILSTLIAKYKKSNVEEKNAVADSTYTFIKQRLNVIASELGDVENKVEKFKQQNKLSDMSEQGKLLVQKTGSFSEELATAETQISILNDLENYLKDESRNKRVFPTSLLPSDLVFSNLMTQYNGLLAERDRALMSVTEATPFVKNLDGQIDLMRKGILANIQSTKNTYVLTSKNLRRQLNEAQGKISGVPEVEKNYLKLARNQKIKEELYIFLMQKAEETAISKTSNISIAKVIAKPKCEAEPVSPKKKIIYFVGLLTGLIAALLLIFGKDFFNSSVATKSDITNLTRVPIVGEISHNVMQDNLIVTNHGRSAIAEQFRALRSNLAFYVRNQSGNVILLTSSMSGEGKSFTAINLANVMALLGKRVLLMELDLRKPGLSTKLNIANTIGFSTYVINEELNGTDVILPLKNMSENLFIIPSGPLPPNPIEILMSDRASTLISEVKDLFDYIIMDAPPVGILADAHSLVHYADMTLYLVRHKVTQKEQVLIADELYTTGKINNLAIVVNDVVSKDYGYGYGYGNYDQVEKVGLLKRMRNIFK